MSDVQLNFIVEPIESVITVQPNDITISLTETLLTVYSGSSPTPGGTNGQLQFNYNGTLGGVPDSNYFSGNLTLGNSSNIKITGGNNGYFLQTDGAGNLVWAAGTGNVSGNASSAGANTSIQIAMVLATLLQHLDSYSIADLMYCPPRAMVHSLVMFLLLIS